VATAKSEQSKKIISEPMSIGVDEAGRGCLAGPVYAGAVIFNGREKSADIRDSKLLSESRREKVYEYILARHRVGIGIATVAEITKLNILGAALLAMKRAIEDLKLCDEETALAHVYVDGNQRIRNLKLKQTTVINGDELMKIIGAASIAAKVNRDREIRRLAKTYPHYGFERHKGYATEEHRRAIAKHGPSDIHRPTFAGVREYLRELV
jgi:ribonuclease HII